MPIAQLCTTNTKWVWCYVVHVMGRNTQADDPRTDAIKRDMADGWAEFEADYRDDKNYEGSTVVYEDDQLVIVADHTGHELNEYLTDHEVPRRVVSNWMHEVAREKTDYDWSASDPIVFDKFEDN